MNRKLLLILDKTVFRAIFYVVVLIAKLNAAKSEPPCSLDAAPRLLVIRPGGLGDGLISVPFLRALRNTWPRSHLTLVCVKKNRATLELLPFHDELVVLDEMAKIFSNIARLRKARFDVLFDLEPFRRTSSVVAWLTGARIRVGFDTNSRRHLYTHLVSYAHDNRFEGANLLHQLRALDIDPPYLLADDLSFTVAEDTRHAATTLLEKNGVDLQRDFLVAVGVGVLKPHHRWIMSEFAALIELVRSEDPRTRVLLIGSPRDVADTREVQGRLPDQGHVIDLVGKTSIVQTLAVLEKCHILVACDGGLVYMAAAMGCGTVSLWGPGVMERFKPLGERHVGVRKSYACIPCVTWERLGEFPPCPYGRRCYNDLTAQEVFAGYRRLKESLAAGGAQSREAAGSLRGLGQGR
jgi:ADP-heptose:LPS heptosyltransferase